MGHGSFGGAEFFVAVGRIWRAVRAHIWVDDLHIRLRGPAWWRERFEEPYWRVSIACGGRWHLLRIAGFQITYSWPRRDASEEDSIHTRETNPGMGNKKRSDSESSFS